MPRKAKHKLTRKRLNNALVSLYRTNPQFFLSEPTKLSIFQHVFEGNFFDLREFFDEPDFNILMRDEDGNGLLWHAMRGRAGFKMVKLLIQNGADINAINFFGKVPLHNLLLDVENLSVDQQRIFFYLLEKGAYLIPERPGITLERILMNTIDSLSDDYENLEYDLYKGNTGLSMMPYNSNEENEVSKRRVIRETKIREEMETLRNYLEVLESMVNRVQEISYEHVKYVNFKDQTSNVNHFIPVDTRMNGYYLQQFVPRVIFHNPSMRVRMLLGSKEIDVDNSLQSQGITEESTITIVLIPTTGFRRGGGHKTRKLKL